jgi:uncharacterized membrane protein
LAEAVSTWQPIDCLLLLSIAAAYSFILIISFFSLWQIFLRHSSDSLLKFSRMAETIENYMPQAGTAANKIGLKVWLVLFFLSAFWLGLILFAPLAKQMGFPALSSAIYYFFGFICHQIPERSFHIGDDIFAVCARCFGVYAGIFLGFLFYPLFRPLNDIEPLPRVWLFLALFPMAVDLGLTFFGIWENTHLSRFLTGAILGAACAVYILPALVEISFKILRRKS